MGMPMFWGSELATWGTLSPAPRPTRELFYVQCTHKEGEFQAKAMNREKWLLPAE